MQAILSLLIVIKPLRQYLLELSLNTNISIWDLYPGMEIALT